MNVRQRTRAILFGTAIGAVFATSAGAQTFKISIGVRETGSTAAIGADGGTAGAIEYINRDGLTLTADGTWQKFTFNFGTDPVTSFVGNGVLDGTTGVFEQIRFLNSSGTTDRVTMLVDDIVNTVGGVDNLITGYEEFAAGNLATFQPGNFSGSSSTNLTGGSTARVITTAANTGVNSYEESFQFVDNSTTRFIRLTTFGTASNLKPNPTIDFTAGNSLSFWLNATVPQIVVGWNTDSDGNWSDASKWAGPSTTGDNIPDTTSEVARFLPTTAPRTVTVDQDYTINGLNFKSPNAYTIAGPNRLTISAPVNSGIDATLVVQSGDHVITAPLAAQARVTASISAGTSLKTPGIIAEVNTAGVITDGIETVSFNKVGDGTFETGHLRFNAVTVNGGTVKITANGTDAATSEVNSLTFVGGTAPTAKLDITNNAMVIDWDSTAPTPRPNAIFSTRNRVITGRNGGDWLGNGITSSTAAGDARFAVGYGDAATLGLTTFVGRAVDSEATVLRLTFLGDATLDGAVGFNDLVALAQNYNEGFVPTDTDFRFWTDGDFNFDGKVGFADLVSLAQNYNATLTPAQIGLLGADFAADFALAQSLVPEPTSLMALGLGAVFLRRRR